MSARPLDILHQTFGYPTFRPHQEQIVEAAVSGRDVMAVMPTSAGKSICYQVPALALGGLTIVVSPLISLMSDQVMALRELGVAAACLNSALDAHERSQTLIEMSRGLLNLVYVAPERLADPAFLDVVQSHGLSLLAVDEAHCISQWGNDFRPSYQRICDFIDALPTRPPVMALTATATRQVREDIEGTLGLRDPLRVVASFDRPNLSFAVERPSGKRAKDKALLEFVRAHEQSSGIVYCMSRRAVEDVCDMLREQGVAATRYHAGLSPEERDRNQADFIYDRSPVMVATNAFGMGIDKSNVSYVVHYNLPLSLENYYQEAGRAGRDGTKAECLLLYTAGDVHTAEFLLSRTERTDLTPDQLQAMHEADEQRLRQMVFYATTTDCLRSFILRYFGEEAPAYCGNCGNCLADYEEVDERTNALKILSCVARVRQHAIACGNPATSVGAGSIVDILRGSKAAKVLERGWDSLSTYGIMADVPVPRIRAIIDELVYREFLTRAQGDYPTLALAGRGAVFMKGDKPFVMRVAKGRPRKPRPEGRTRGASAAELPDLTPEQAELFEALRSLRTRLAREQQVPPYLIFNNATLEDMCRKRPTTPDELLEVSGVGTKKAERYGEAFLEVIADNR
ncbi:DNA helicase RecQ [uncultured Parolsenella sp.]|uniref:DNA helicase RecQ n=1 Tax=uncultured Parolsenella sp. TaxID=2083008 RepID=UPI0027DC17D8|nr:DNA helicase RecQ [uncultured Parolsenella sp.]